MLSLGELILAALLQFIWILLIQGPLALISIAQYALQFMSGGLQWILFFNTPIKVLDGIIVPPAFEDLKIPYPFIGMLILSFSVGVVVFIIQMCKIYGTSSFQTQPIGQKIIQSIKLAACSILVAISIPVIFFLTTIMLTFFVSAISKIFMAGESKTLADYVYLIGYMGDPDFPPKIPSDFGPPSAAHILQYNMLVQIAGVLFSLIGIAMMTWLIVIKTVELLFLFFTGPIFASLMPTDGGKKLSIWKDMVISKNCVIIANYMGFWLFMYLLQVTVNIANGINQDIFPELSMFSVTLLRALIFLAFIAGGAIGTWQLGPLVAAFFGDAFGFRESMAQGKALLGGAMMAKAGAAGVKKFFGFAKNNNDGGGGNNPSNNSNAGSAFIEKFKSAVGKTKSLKAIPKGVGGLVKGTGAAIKTSISNKYNNSKIKSGIKKGELRSNVSSYLDNNKKQLDRIKRSAANGYAPAKAIMEQYNFYKDVQQKTYENNVNRAANI